MGLKIWRKKDTDHWEGLKKAEGWNAGNAYKTLRDF